MLDNVRRRAELLAAAAEFVARVVNVRGVRSVALLGSITTERRNPKDVDLLVTIDAGADVSLLAKHARQPEGTTQQ
jgi:predicted nucleotidyltransferase